MALLCLPAAVWAWEQGMVQRLPGWALWVMLGGAVAAMLAARHNADPAVVAATSAGLRTGFGNSIWALFPVATVILALAFLVTLTVPALKLRGREAPPARDVPVTAATAT